MKLATTFPKTDVALFELCMNFVQEKECLLLALGILFYRESTLSKNCTELLSGKNLTISVRAEKPPKRIKYDIAFALSI